MGNVTTISNSLDSAVHYQSLNPLEYDVNNVEDTTEQQ